MQRSDNRLAEKEKRKNFFGNKENSKLNFQGIYNFGRVSFIVSSVSGRSVELKKQRT